MKTFVCIIVIGSFFTSCIAQKNSWTGNIPIKQVEDKFSWFTSGYNEYIPDTLAITQLKDKLPAYTVLVFAGTWCGDTKELLPQFYKSIDMAGFPREKVELYLLDNKKESPDRKESSYEITAIPAFILLRDGKEQGRIVESTERSIEEDVLELIK